jgi:hypothetical protein
LKIERSVEDKIRLAFPDNAELMIRIAKAESGLNVNAYNPEWHRGCQGSYGLFQIGCVNYSGNSQDLFDVDLNIEIAQKVLASQGLNAWGPCRTGKISCKE